MLCGLTPPAVGEIRWRGEPIGKLGDDFRAELCYLGHHNAIKEELTPLENLLASAKLAEETLAEDTALDALESRWLAAGPARAMLDHLRTNPDSEMDIERFVSGPVLQESATLPGPTDLSDLLLELLRPEGAYRLVWNIPNLDPHVDNP